MQLIRRRGVRWGIIGALALLVAGLVAIIAPSADAATITLAPTAITTTAGRVGADQTVRNLATRDLSGHTDGWNRYVELIGRYAGYLTFTLPADIAPGAVQSLGVQIGYRGPAPRTQPWTFALYDFGTGEFTTIGTNAAAPDWGDWSVLSFTAAGPFARYVDRDATLRLGIQAGNARDAADLDFAALTLTWNPGSAPAAGSSTTVRATNRATPTFTATTTARSRPSSTAVQPAPGTSTIGTATTPPGGATTGSTTCPQCWHPAVQTSWDWVIATVPKAPYRNVAVYDIDGFDAQASDVQALHHAGKKVICYISVGTYEDWRPDAGAFPSKILGSSVEGWAGERWLDVRDVQTSGSVLAQIMNARLDTCRAKGFDAVEFDNMDGYSNRSGFPLTAADQVRYDSYLAQQAHARGLSAAMKNDGDQVADLLPYFDMALNEECNQYDECGAFSPFVAAGKPVFQVEYGSSKSFCARDNQLNFNGLRLSIDLDGSVFDPCR